MTAQQKPKLHTVYVYGTLRPGNTEVVLVPGCLYDLGWYPGIKLKSPEAKSFVACEILQVTGERLEQLDHYEGYNPTDPGNSLYIRRPYLGGWIYEYNQAVSKSQRLYVEDWLEHRAKQKEGVSA